MLLVSVSMMAPCYWLPVMYAAVPAQQYCVLVDDVFADLLLFRTAI